MDRLPTTVVQILAPMAEDTPLWTNWLKLITGSFSPLIGEVTATRSPRTCQRGYRHVIHWKDVRRPAEIDARDAVCSKDEIKKQISGWWHQSALGSFSQEREKDPDTFWFYQNFPKKGTVKSFTNTRWPKGTERLESRKEDTVLRKIKCRLFYVWD